MCIGIWNIPEKWSNGGICGVMVVFVGRCMSTSLQYRKTLRLQAKSNKLLFARFLWSLMIINTLANCHMINLKAVISNHLFLEDCKLLANQSYISKRRAIKSYTTKV